MATDEIQSFKKLFLWLYETHQPYFLDIRDAEQRLLYEELVRRFTPITDAHLEAGLPSEKNKLFDSLSVGAFLYLSPNPSPRFTKKQSFLPFISIVCDFRTTPAVVRIGVAFACMHSGEVRICGLRFETPEGTGGGYHDFYHAQFISQFISESGRTFNLNEGSSSLDWLPQSQPSIPLDACCPTSLVLNVLVGIYGIQYMEELSINRVVDHSHLEIVRNWRRLPRYWAAESKQGKRYVFKTSSPRTNELSKRIGAVVNDDKAPIAKASCEEYDQALRDGRGTDLSQFD